MKRFFFIAILLCSLTLVTSGADHPIKLTSSEIKYDHKAKQVRVICKVFIDDFSPAIHPDLLASLEDSKLPKEQMVRIEKYFESKYKIAVNGKRFPWKIVSFDVGNNILTIHFEEVSMSIKKGDKLEIENALLFEAFGDIQSNWMTLRFPPLLKNHNFENNTFNTDYSHTF